MAVTMLEKIKVMVIDNSAVARKLIRSIIDQDDQMELVDASPSPTFALRVMENNWPSVIILDLDLPEMDGFTFIQQVMSTRPTPILIYSNQAEAGARLALEVTNLGAVGVIAKPNVYGEVSDEAASQIGDAIKEAACSSRHNNQHKLNANRPSKFDHAVQAKEVKTAFEFTPEDHQQKPYQLIAIGSSLGGVEAIENILIRLPVTTPGIIIVQHMPEGYTGALASRLNGICKIEVREAQDYDHVVAGRALIANGGKHLVVRGAKDNYHVRISDGELVSRHRPSVDVLFSSVAGWVGRRALGVILTGMGSDGAEGIKNMYDVGCHTIAQNRASCVVYGMPDEAVKKGGVCQILALDDIAAFL